MLEIYRSKYGFSFLRFSPKNLISRFVRINEGVPLIVEG